MTRNRPPVIRPPGKSRNLWRSTLDAGSRVMQSRAPLGGFDIYVAGLHCARRCATMQMEAHHYCKQVNADFLQCVLFDGNTADANLIGVEYIVSEQIFAALPDAEKRYWHPHNYEILSGQLVAPGLPKAAEHALLKLLVNSYGKTWHTWQTGRHDGVGPPADPLPLGEAELMWSFNSDGEADPRLKDDLLAALGEDEAANRARRLDLAAGAHPQRGVNAMQSEFPAADGRPEGVRDDSED
jgi:hypothetical protein